MENLKFQGACILVFPTCCFSWFWTEWMNVCVLTSVLYWYQWRLNSHFKVIFVLLRLILLFTIHIIKIDYNFIIKMITIYREQMKTSYIIYLFAFKRRPPFLQTKEVIKIDYIYIVFTCGRPYSRAFPYNRSLNNHTNSQRRCPYDTYGSLKETKQWTETKLCLLILQPILFKHKFQRPSFLPILTYLCCVYLEVKTA